MGKIASVPIPVTLANPSPARRVRVCDAVCFFCFLFNVIPYVNILQWGWVQGNGQESY